ncbi:MAG: hypothetical protein Q8L29_01910 [archaeon]|nr:hypothetical protein [archaeon]
MNYQDNNVPLYMLDSKRMKEFLGVIQSINELGKIRRFPKDKLQLEINLNSENGCSDEINLSIESSDSILDRLRNARLYLVDNYNQDNKAEWMHIQRLGSENYWINFPRTAYDKVSVLEKELRKVVNSEPLDISSRLIHAPGVLDSVHKASGYKAPSEIPGNKNDRVREVLKKGNNDKLSQSQVSAMVSVVFDRRKGLKSKAI